MSRILDLMAMSQLQMMQGEVKKLLSEEKYAKTKERMLPIFSRGQEEIFKTLGREVTKLETITILVHRAITQNKGETEVALIGAMGFEWIQEG